MNSGDPLCDPPPTRFQTSHAWQSQATVNPADVFLSQPPQSMDSSGIPHITELNHILSAEGHATQEGPQSCLPTWHAQPMGHSSGLFFNDAARSFIGPIRHFRRTFRGIPVTDAASTTCQWQHMGFPICGQDVTRQSLSEHLAHHGIYKMRKDLIVQCCWQGCGALIKRQSIARHCREVHLRLKRKSPNFQACFWDALVIDVF